MLYIWLVLMHLLHIPFTSGLLIANVLLQAGQRQASVLGHQCRHCTGRQVLPLLWVFSHLPWRPLAQFPTSALLVFRFLERILNHIDLMKVHLYIALIYIQLFDKTFEIMSWLHQDIDLTYGIKMYVSPFAEYLMEVIWRIFHKLVRNS